MLGFLEKNPQLGKNSSEFKYFFAKQREVITLNHFPEREGGKNKVLPVVDLFFNVALSAPTLNLVSGLLILERFSV